MKLLHTSDWHLGRSLYGKKRYAEFEAFLNWLADTIAHNSIDALLVAGDIFDNSAPSNSAQELYYRFLCRVAKSACRHVVIIAGNHDSPSFLNAPKELLKAMDVHVVASITDSLDDEVLVLKDRGGAPELIVCAVPFLRDRDIRIAEAGEAFEDKERKLIEGISAHYATVAALAEQKRKELGADIPIVGMGHLFTAGGQTVEGDAVRELYVGSLAHVSAGIFPLCFNYLALGHLHVPQKVGGIESMRYSGSPIAMGFGEAKQEKSLCLLDFNGSKPSIQLLAVPSFQELDRIKGDWDFISERIAKLSASAYPIWLEVIYDGEELIGDLRERLEDAISGTQLEVLRIKNNHIIEHVLGQMHAEETLDDLDENDVFERCLAIYNLSEDERAGLRLTYQEALMSIYEDAKQEEQGADA